MPDRRKEGYSRRRESGARIDAATFPKPEVPNGSFFTHPTLLYNGSIAPLQAAELAAKAGLRIYTIGIGAEEMTIRDLLGSRTVNPSQDLDEPTMRGIAEKTGGRYFRARDVRELEGIYRLLDELEPIERDKRYYRPRTELYPWPLGAALLLSGLIYLARRHQASA